MKARRLLQVCSLDVATIAAVALLAMSAAGCVLGAQSPRVEGTFDRTLSVTGPVDVAVKTGSGNIQITVGAGDTVRVVGHIRAGGSFLWSTVNPVEQVKDLETNPPIEQRGNTIQIGEIKDVQLRQNVRISYEVIVPADTRVRSETGSGDQSIDAIRGPVEARTGSGDIRTGRIGGHVSLSTGSGDVQLGGADGGLDVRTGSGDIAADGIAGAIKAQTGSGDLRIAQTAAGGVEASTGSGSIIITGAQGPARIRTGSGDITVDGAPTGDWVLSAASGNVTVRVPADAAFDLDARAASGSVETTHAIELSGRLSKQRFQGKVHGGGARLDVSTGSGAIRID